MKRFKVTGESEIEEYLWFQLFGASCPQGMVAVMKKKY